MTWLMMMTTTLIGSLPSCIALKSSTSLHTSSRLSSSVTVRAEMASPSTSFSGISTLPKDRIILGVGGLTLDYLATVANYPEPDDKIRSIDMKVQGGGNAGNALTCASRLGLVPRLISKVANDGQGRGMLEELEADGVDTSFLVVSKEGNSPFTYIIVDNQTKTRTCIHTPGFPPMIPEDLPQSSLSSSLDGVSLLYLDGRLHESALVVAHEAKQRNIPILIDAEKKREGLDDLLNLSDYVVCSAKFPQAWTEASSIPSALLSMLVRLPRLKFVIVTLGEVGCIMLERSETESIESEEMCVDDLLELLMLRKDMTTNTPTCISSVVTKMQANGIGMITGTLYVCTTEKIPFSELIDTTGAGDAFIGAVLYGSC
ncbi:ribokinase-like isoform X2 [Impatiens glandulifera]|uniref:ribokinase-like isoform X2 n=1 Tax=Impatiens glandulifera TaxID=253017 RepID=UPI001FB10C47|nr:ribokinase-like isoform X2 [Impatiens glandulifera]